MRGSPAEPCVRVELGPRSYEIRIGAALVDHAGGLLRDWLAPTRAVVIADAQVMAVAERVRVSLGAAGIAAEVLEVPSGEASKCVAQAERLWNELLARGADRRTVVVAVGGGVVGDLAGFVAATFARGVPWVQVPTTLLALVDSSVGGKVGLNLPLAKNMVGAFWQPAGVLADVSTLSTLADREYRSGLAEVVKYGVILDAAFFARLARLTAALRERQSAALVEIVTHACRLKAQVVAADEREESGLRAVLNYGHTFAHALETVRGYGQLLHGEAVAIGMTCAARLAERLGRVDSTLRSSQTALLESLGLPTSIGSADRRQLLAAMQRDKKTEYGRLRFVLPTRLGHVELVGQVDPSQVLAAMEDD